MFCDLLLKTVCSELMYSLCWAKRQYLIKSESFKDNVNLLNVNIRGKQCNFFNEGWPAIKRSFVFIWHSVRVNILGYSSRYQVWFAPWSDFSIFTKLKGFITCPELKAAVLIVKLSLLRVWLLKDFNKKKIVIFKNKKGDTKSTPC